MGLTQPTSGTATVSGRRFADRRNPGLEVGVLLDASAQHAGRTWREILTLAQRAMGLPQRRVGRVLTKLGLRDRVQAVVMAYETGFVVPDRPGRSGG